MGRLCLSLLETKKVSSKASTPFCTLTSNEWEFLLFCNFTNNWYFQVLGGFWFVLVQFIAFFFKFWAIFIEMWRCLCYFESLTLLWQTMLSLFSHVHFPPLWLFGEYLFRYFNHLLIFWSFFWVLRILWIFWIQII